MWFTVPNGTLALKAHLAVPAGKGPFPGILVIQEIFGVNAHIRETADKLAQAGFLALAPPIFQRTAPDLELGYEPEDLAEGRKHKEQTTTVQLMSDLEACLDALEKRPDCSGKFGVVGFCFGGHIAFLAAGLSRVSATASFYGAGIATTTPGGGPPSLTQAAKIHGRIELFFGERDPLIPKEQVDRIAVELENARVDHRIVRYSAGHGFFCDHRKDYDRASADDAWKKTLTLFDRLRS